MLLLNVAVAQLCGGAFISMAKTRTCDAYVSPDGRVHYFGNKAENFKFKKCMNGLGYPLR